MQNEEKKHSEKNQYPPERISWGSSRKQCRRQILKLFFNAKQAKTQITLRDKLMIAIINSV